MLDRIIATLLLWGLRGCLAWFVMHEATSVAVEKLDEVARALGTLQAGLEARLPVSYLLLPISSMTTAASLKA